MTGSESPARKAIYTRLSKIRKFGSRTITISTELLALFVEDYDLLSKEYNNLKEKIENYEKQKSTLLTPTKLEEFIKITDQVIKINEQTIKDLDQKHEMARNFLDQKCKLDEMSKNFIIDQDEIKKEYNEEINNKLIWLSDEEENFGMGNSRINGISDCRYIYETDESNADGERSNWDTESEGNDSDNQNLIFNNNNNDVEIGNLIDLSDTETDSSSYRNEKIARM
ncbi:hypothetical protein Glove_350g172 [Diversispora epigaea]|uniref:Uncharacterized protein n=1 Tax=Diversispora epigaea TaxID=1348612 RepID=A0A397HCQ8_9GLOM|nr:hypothetical protein Glove_350g172 [Diversispora epigaea]